MLLANEYLSRLWCEILHRSSTDARSYMQAATWQSCSRTCCWCCCSRRAGTPCQLCTPKQPPVARSCLRQQAFRALRIWPMQLLE